MIRVSGICMISRKYTKKGVFYLIDTVLALTLLIVGGVVIYSSSFFVPYVGQLDTYATEYQDILLKNNLSEFVDGEILQLRLGNPNISMFLDRPIMEYILYSADKGNPSHAEVILNRTVLQTFPSGFNFEFYIDGSTRVDSQIPFYTISNRPLTQNDALAVVSQSRIYISELNGEIFGPFVLRVVVW